MRILGIDPGSKRIGFGIIEHVHGKFSCVAYGAIDLPPDTNRARDLQYTVSELSTLIKRFKPSLAVIEKLFFTKNQKTAMAVSETRGVLLLTCANHNLQIQELTPMQVKQAVSGYGAADKAQVQHMMKLVFGLAEDIRPDDAADALALALSYTALGTPGERG